ncbi:MAG: hypothetical protein Q9178_007966 [Gyalolechia marmorata]
MYTSQLLTTLSLLTLPLTIISAPTPAPYGVTSPGQIYWILSATVATTNGEGVYGITNTNKHVEMTVKGMADDAADVPCSGDVTIAKDSLDSQSSELVCNDPQVKVGVTTSFTNGWVRVRVQDRARKQAFQTLDASQFNCASTGEDASTCTLGSAVVMSLQHIGIRLPRPQNWQKWVSFLFRVHPLLQQEFEQGHHRRLRLPPCLRSPEPSLPAPTATRPAPKPHQNLQHAAPMAVGIMIHKDEKHTSDEHSRDH